jgi:uncharacterized membrane protein
MKKPPAKRPPQPSNGNHTHISVQSHKWEAPLPPPSVLEGFNDVVPDGAERIVRAWEQESQHRREIEKAEQRSYYRDALVGKVFALIFVLAALGVSAFAAFIGAEWLGAVLGAGTIGSVVWAFISRQKPKQ